MSEALQGYGRGSAALGLRVVVLRHKGGWALEQLQ